MPRSPRFSLSSRKSQASPPQNEDRDACFPEQDINTFSLRIAAQNRRHSADGTLGSGSDRDPVVRFYPYCRQLSDGAAEAEGYLQQSTSSFGSLQEVFSSDTCSGSGDVPATWEQFNSSVQSLYSDPPVAPVEPYSSFSQSYPSYSSLSPLQQVSSKLYVNDNQPENSKYSLQSLSTKSHVESSTQSLFPKPIYSYSILIFMALKYSKTGSLPVSEIYSFMTEHFPYFKTAPDGWKNSVRHNLSLNKCFEKVENKNGNTSRKGCLWALNPAKVEKMQEELHKWRRKDPLTVRRSMARPEDLDRLLGERPDKVRSLQHHNARVAPIYSPNSSSSTPAQPQAARQSQYAPIQPQQPHFLPLAAAHPSNSFFLYSPCGQQPTAGVPSAPGCLNSPVAGKMPPVYSVTSPDYSTGPRGMQELLQEGDTAYDIDTLNPSLTDLQLQGSLWEELRQESLVSEPRLTSTSFVLQDHHVQTSCLQPPPSSSHTSARSVGGCCKAAYEDEDVDRSYWNGWHPVGYSGVESLSGHLTSCTTSVSLM
ncbi:forkhead box protein N1 [Nothobranchius furzeri]|uniref:Forkhead box N1 n=1 Tax=Nothobranchius furzeri TaxID=105023 RepID=A0A8C6KCZ8_NOTFU|nr:forkhead box protein N1 [Nothobranchius furzeri]KAF7219020.1 forkhead box N1 [Nothobranchius furzeri]